MNRTTAAVVLAVFTFWPQISQAGNDRSHFLGNEAALTAGSGVAVTRDSEALWYNPAGLGGLEAGKLELSGSAFMLKLRTMPNLLVTNLHTGRHSFDPTAHQILAAPTAFILVRRGTKNLSWGVGVFVPESDLANLRHNFSSPDTVPGLTDARYTQGLGYDSQRFLYRLGPALGWQIIPRLRLGAGLFFVYLSWKYNVQYFGQLTGDHLGDEVNTHYNALQQLTVNLVGLMAFVGLQWEFVRGWHLGLVVRTPSLGLYRWGKQSATTSIAQLDANFNLVTNLIHESQKLNGWVLTMIEPVSITLAFGYRGRSWWVGVEGTVTPPLGRDIALVSREFQWNLSTGGRFRIYKSLSGGAGFFTDRSPYKDPRELYNHKVDYYGFTLGIDYRSSFSVKGKRGPRKLTFSTVLGFRYAVGVGQVGGVYYDFAGTGDFNTVPTDVTFHEVAVHIGSGLYF
jgi:hypothetical protein